MDLMERKKTQKGDINLSKLVQDKSISIYNETDFKIKFGLHVRRFWKEWDKLDVAIQNCLPGLEKDHARAFVVKYGG